jgi:hypothetical protein
VNAVQDALEILFTVPLLFVIPGYALVKSRLFKARRSSWISRVVLVIALSAGVASLAALSYGEMGYLRIWLLDLTLAVFSLAVWLVFGRTRVPVFEKRPRPIEAVVVIALCVLSILLFFRPFEYIAGDGDPGYYFNSGYHIAETGAVNITDEAATRMDDVELKTFYDNGIAGFIPFHLRSRQTGKTQPQLYDMLPVWIGIFILLFGKSGGLYVVPLFALFSVLAFFALARRFTGVFGAACGALLFCLVFPQAYFARMPVSEMFCQFLVLAALLFFSEFLAEECPLSGLACAVSVTVAASVRPEALILFLPLLTVMAARLFRRRYRVGDYVTVNSLLAGMAFVWLYVMAAEYHYVRRNARKLFEALGTTTGGMTTFMGLWLAATGIALAVFNLPWINKRLCGIWSRFEGRMGEKRFWDLRVLKGALASLTLLSFVYFYFITPAWASSVASPRNFFFYTSEYFGGVAVFVFVAGLCWLLFDADDAGFSFVVTSSLILYGLVFSEAVGTRGWQPWLSRRFMVVTIPMLMLGFAFLAGRLWDSKKPFLRATALLGAACFVVLFCFFLAPFAGHVEYKGIDRQYRELAEKVDGDVVIFTDPFVGEAVGIPLRYQYGVDARRAWDLNDTATFRDIVRGYVEEGREVLIETGGLTYANARPDFSEVLDLEKAFDYEVKFPRTSKSYKVRPWATGTERHDLTFFKVQP